MTKLENNKVQILIADIYQEVHQQVADLKNVMPEIEYSELDMQDNGINYHCYKLVATRKDAYTLLDSLNDWLSNHIEFAFFNPGEIGNRLRVYDIISLWIKSILIAVS